MYSIVEAAEFIPGYQRLAQERHRLAEEEFRSEGFIDLPIDRQIDIIDRLNEHLCTTVT